MLYANNYINWIIKYIYESRLMVKTSHTKICGFLKVKEKIMTHFYTIRSNTWNIYFLLNAHMSINQLIHLII